MLPAADRYPFAAGSFTDAEHAAGLFTRYPMYQAGLEWIAGFVARPDPRIGRPGHVCPWVAHALDRNLVRLVAVPVTSSSAAEAREKCIHLAGLYEEVFGDPAEFAAGALLAFFPGIDPARAGDFIDGGHRQLRLLFARRGLMLGEFHPASTVTSVRNPRFVVMRCPVPLFAVRAMSVHDLMFLDRPGTQPREAAPYLRQYLTNLGSRVSSQVRQQLLSRLTSGAA